VPRRELLIAAGAGEWRAALAEGGAAVELYVERGDGEEVGSIHLGRVVRKLPALAALLVDIGGARPIFLAERDLLPRGKVPDEGERIVLQIRREAQGGKSARGTMRLSLRRGAVELVGGAAGVAGREALPPEHHDRLAATLGSAAPEAAAGLRFVGAPSAEAALAEVALLTRLWVDIHEQARSLAPPLRLYPPATFAGALAGAMPVAPERIVVDAAAAVPEIRAAFADTPVRVEPEALWPLDLDAVFDEALAPTVALAGGGAVHIEPARAAVLIDVDSGSPAAGVPEQMRLAADLVAAAAIARHIRLRNLGGGIVVDFVGLDRARARKEVGSALAEALTSDPLRPQILGWTRLGHLELMRPRHGRPLADALCERSAGGVFVKSAPTVAHEALRAVRSAARAEPGRGWEIAVAPEVAAALAGPLAAARGALEAWLARGLAVRAEPGRARDRFDIRPR
jgi:ribonuclease G